MAEMKVDLLAAKEFAGKELEEAAKKKDDFFASNSEMVTQIKDHTDKFWAVNPKLVAEIVRRTTEPTWQRVKCRQLAYLVTTGDFDKENGVESPDKQERVQDPSGPPGQMVYSSYFDRVVRRRLKDVCYATSLYDQVGSLAGMWWFMDQFTPITDPAECVTGSIALFAEKPGGGVADLHAFFKGRDGAWYCAWRRAHKRNKDSKEDKPGSMKWLCRAKPGLIESKPERYDWTFVHFFNPNYDGGYGDGSRADLLEPRNLSEEDLYTDPDLKYDDPEMGPNDRLRLDIKNPQSWHFHTIKDFADKFFKFKGPAAAKLKMRELLQSKRHSLEVAYIFSRNLEPPKGPKNKPDMGPLKEHTRVVVTRSESLLREHVHAEVKTVQKQWWLEHGFREPKTPIADKAKVFEEVSKENMAVALYMRWGLGGGIEDPHASFMTQNKDWWAKWGEEGSSSGNLDWISKVKKAEIEDQKTVAGYEFNTFLIPTKSKFIVESMRGYEEDGGAYGGHSHYEHYENDGTMGPRDMDRFAVYDADANAEDEAILRRFRKHRVAREHVRLRQENRLLTAQLHDLRGRMVAMIGDLSRSHKLSRRSGKH